MKASQGIVNALNRNREDGDCRQSVVDVYWYATERSHCFDMHCTYHHEFGIGIGVVHNECNGDAEWPRARIIIERDDDEWMSIPLSKAMLAEFIADAKACFEELP